LLRKIVFKAFSALHTVMRILMVWSSVFDNPVLLAVEGLPHDQPDFAAEYLLQESEVFFAKHFKKPQEKHVDDAP
jgi:hypothetical protein